MAGFRLSPLNQRRWRNFTLNRRAYWSLWIFLILYVLSLGAELLANDRPLLVKYQGSYYTPFLSFYSEQTFGGDLRTEANYTTPEVQCLIVAGGSLDCWDDPEGIMAEAQSQGTALGQPVDAGWILWPLIPYSYNTIVNTGGVAPGAPSDQNWLGTDDASRDVLARVIYGFRLSVTFALIVTALTTVIGIAAGAVQGYFGGRTDLIFQRVIELWGSVPSLYVIIILTAIWAKSFWLMVFSWSSSAGRPSWAWCAPNSCARATSNMSAPPRAGGARLADHVPPHAAQCHGRHADDAPLHRHRHHRQPRDARLPRFRPAFRRAVAGPADAAGQGKPPGPASGLGQLLHLRPDADAPDLHLRRHPRCLRPAEDLQMTILDVRDLKIAFRQDGRVIEAVRGVSFTVGKGETVALVGESGSGKSVTALATVGLLSDNATRSGHVLWQGNNLSAFPNTSCAACAATTSASSSRSR